MSQKQLPPVLSYTIDGYCSRKGLGFSRFVVSHFGGMEVMQSIENQVSRAKTNASPAKSNPHKSGWEIR